MAIIYLTARYPAWSETFIAQEIALMREQLPLIPVAVWHDGTPSDTIRVYLAGQCHPAAPAIGTSTPGILPPVVHRVAAVGRHREKLNALCRFAADHNVRHIHAAFADLPGLLAASAARQLKISYSVSVHAADGVCPKYDDQYIYQHAKFVIACNQRVHDILVERIQPRCRCPIHLIHHGVVLDEWPFKPNSGLNKPPFRLLFVGRLVDKKCPELALAVPAALAKLGCDATLTVAGDGPLAPSLQSATPRDQKRITWLGHIPRHRVHDEMTQADCVLITSDELKNGDMEGVPNVMVEAMASGRPVIATTSGSMSELLDITTGYPINERSPAAIAAMVQHLIRHPDEMRQRVAAARKRIESDFDANKRISERVQLLKSVL